MTEEEKPLEEFDLSDIESVLWHGVADGKIKPSGMKNGELTFSLTSEGEEDAVKLFGGKDVLEVAKVLNSNFEKHGVSGFPLPEGNEFRIFILITTMCHMFKYFNNWDSLKEATEDVQK